MCAVPQVSFRLSINESSPLPPGQDTPLLAEFQLTGVAAAKAKHIDTDKISIHFRSAMPAQFMICDRLGLLHDTVCALECFLYAQKPALLAGLAPASPHAWNALMPLT